MIELRLGMGGGKGALVSQTEACICTEGLSSGIRRCKQRRVGSTGRGR